MSARRRLLLCRCCPHCPRSVALLPRPSCHRRTACAKLQKPPAATAAAIMPPTLPPLRCRRQAVTMLPPSAAAAVPSPSCRHPHCRHCHPTVTAALPPRPAVAAATLQLPPLSCHRRAVHHRQHHQIAAALAVLALFVGRPRLSVATDRRLVGVSRIQDRVRKSGTNKSPTKYQ